MKHVKPTKEELQAKIDASLKDIETPDPEPTPPEVPAAPTPPEPETPPETPEVPPTPPELPVTPEPTPPEVPAEPKKLPSAEERYQESSNEARILYARNSAMNEAILKAKALPEPTEEELKAVNPDWDVMSDFERKTAKNNFINERRWSLVDESTKPFVDMEKWAAEVKTFIDDPIKMKAHPELAGKENQFIEYATRVTKSGVPFEVLIPAFLHSENLKKVPNKGQMFPTPAGGPNEIVKPKSDVLTVSEGMALMKKDMKQYRELLAAGKISLDPDYQR